MENSNLPSPSEVKEVYSPKEVVAQESKDTDIHGREIFEESVVQRISHPDFIFMHETLREVIDKDLVPPDDIGPMMTLLEMLADQEKDVYDTGAFILPINYCVGLWHCLNTGRKFHIYEKFKKKDKTLDIITNRIAKSLDAYHKAKIHEEKEGMVTDKSYLEYMGKAGLLPNKKQKAVKSIGGFKNPFIKKLKGTR